MLLVIDVGNTETVLGLYREKTLISHWRMSSKVQRTSDECWILLKMWMDQVSESGSSIRGVAIASVVPSLTSVFSDMAHRHLGIDPLMIGADVDTGLVLLYDSPGTVGADRICNAVAGYHRFGGPLIVVDFGTATTFDVITEKGEYAGGVISLGLSGTAYELHRLAAKLPHVGLVFPSAVIGRNTEDSMRSGIMWGAVAMVDGMIQYIQNEMSWKEIQAVATGGAAACVAQKTQRVNRVEPDLTLEGMRLIYDRNRS